MLDSAFGLPGLGGGVSGEAAGNMLVACECIVHDVDDLHAELMEIDENLARAELSPAEEAAHVRRRQEIWEIKNGPAKANSKSLRAVQVAAQRGRELGFEISRIVGTSLDKGVEMDALIKLPGP